MTRMRTRQPAEEPALPPARFPPDLLYRAARLYYLEDATQAEVATTLGTSRPTVSRLLAEARASGIVHIEIREPGAVPVEELAAELALALGLKDAHVTQSASGVPLGTVLAPGVTAALGRAQLGPGDGLLVSSGASVYAVAQQPLPSLPGVLLAPTVGGVDEPEEYYQTNEITRSLAVKVHGSPVNLYAPAMPSEALYPVLMQDSLIRRVTSLWSTAKAALLGIGAPPRTRSSLPSFLPKDLPEIDGAIGDICARPFDVNGTPINFPGAERLVAMELADLRRIPHCIGLAVGAAKVPAIRAAAKSGYINILVTDAPTAQLILAAIRNEAGPVDSEEGSLP
jgi:DNA-binding transcriptional regulator LsrR (DeoR family)